MRSMMIGLVGLLSTVSLIAQSTRSVRINEVVVNNQAGVFSPYGERVAWVELYNAGAGTTNLKGCYLTNDLTNLKKYRIPMSDARTVLPPYRHLLFWADGVAPRGAFHLNFLLSPDEEQTIALVDTDGETIIDKVTIPASLGADASLARIPDGVLASIVPDVWQVRSQPTPEANNVMPEINEKVERLKTEDSVGGIMTITAMLVVFSGLILLSLSFLGIGRVALRLSAMNKRKANAPTVTPVVKSNPNEEVFVAITLALTEELDNVHDDNGDRLTIEHHERRYSPWSAKVYNQRSSVVRKPFAPRK